MWPPGKQILYSISAKKFASNWTKATKNALVTLKETTKTETYSKAAEAPAV